MNFIFHWCTERIEPDKFDDWWFLMNQPLPHQDKKKVSEAMIEDEGQGFMALMQQGTR